MEYINGKSASILGNLPGADVSLFTTHPTSLDEVPAQEIQKMLRKDYYDTLLDYMIKHGAGDHQPDAVLAAAK